jgi:hypothetical protein
MTEQPVLDVIDSERLAQQRIVAQVNHADGEIVTRAPPCIDAAQFLGAQRAGRDASLRFCDGCHW